MTLAALAFGATAVIFAVGLHSSLSRAAAAQNLTATVPVQIQQNGSGNGPQQPRRAPARRRRRPPRSSPRWPRSLRAQPGTAHR